MEHFAESDGARISYQVEGPEDAPALLLLNSICSTRELWARNMPAFTSAFRVIRYDARGHGRSSVPAGDYTIEQLGGDALAVLDAAGAASAHLCGISLGGLTAMWLGLHAPAQVARLILANTGARIGSLQSWTDRIALVRERGMTGVAERNIPLWFTPSFRERDPDTVHTFRAMVQSCPADGYLGCCAALRDTDLRDALPAITAPVLVIGGTVDASTPLELSELIRDRIRGARLVALETAHLSNVEQSEAFSAVVVEFLTRL